ncbi:unnamed protein product [Ixodes pacificus]
MKRTRAGKFLPAGEGCPDESAWSPEETAERALDPVNGRLIHNCGSGVGIAGSSPAQKGRPFEIANPAYVPRLATSRCKARTRRHAASVPEPVSRCTISQPEGRGRSTRSASGVIRRRPNRAARATATEAGATKMRWRRPPHRVCRPAPRRKGRQCGSPWETDRSRRAGIPLEAATKDGRRPSPTARHTTRQGTSFLPPTTAFSGSSLARVTRGKRRTEQRASDSSAKSSGPLQIKLRVRSQRDFQARDDSRREPTARDSTTLETTRRRMRGTPKE